MNFELETPGDTAEVKKESVLERLNKRNKERQNHLDVQLEHRNKENLQLEGVDYFAQAFADRVQKIETLLESARDMPKPPTAPNGAGNGNDVQRLFAETSLEIQELQRYLSTSTMFLPDFKIKACQAILSQLTTTCEELRLKMMPKKKFGFSGKMVSSQSCMNPKVADKVKTPEKKKKPKGSGRDSFTWTLFNRTGEYILLQGDAVNGMDVTISNLKNCLVEIHGHPGSVQISSLVDCIFICGPIARSLFAEHCDRCMMAVACQQLRLHSSKKCRLYLHVTCRAIIEDCSQIEVTEYSYCYPNIESDFFMAGLDRSQNNYTDVADFNWLSADVPSPNWKLLENRPTTNWELVREAFQRRQAMNL